MSQDESKKPNLDEFIRQRSMGITPAGIAIPNDRTCKQPVVGYCSNPACRENGQEFRFQCEHDHFACPKCGANQAPMVGTLVLIHLLVPDKMGHVVGSGGLRYRLACDQGRHHLATYTNQEAASGDPDVVNCPQCLRVAVEQKLLAPVGFALVFDKS